MTKLTDTQLIILSRAAARDDGCATLPEGKKVAGALKAGTSLIDRKLMKEVRAKPDMPVWRTDEEKRAYSLVLTAAGRKAIRAEEPDEQTMSVSDGKAPATSVPASAKAVRPARARKAAAPTEAAGAPGEAASPSTPSADLTGPKPLRETSKQALVVKMLSTRGGTTVAALVEATGWLPHTTRAALTGLRKRGFAIAREPQEGKPSLYRIQVMEPVTATNAATAPAQPKRRGRRNEAVQAAA